MLMQGQTFLKKWKRSNKEWYEAKGYLFTNCGDVFHVKAEDLTKGDHQKVKVQCDYCGEIHDVIWKDYYKRRNQKKYACNNCRLKKASESTQQERRENLYERAKQFCDDNDYILLTPKENILNSETRVDYQCKKHGVHNVKLYSLISGHKCNECMQECKQLNKRIPINNIISYIEEHGSKLLNPEDYSKSTDKNLKVICPECGKTFSTSFFSFRKAKGQRCPDCSKIESKGELIVRKYLESHNILFETQYRFKNCRTSVPLPFDFYLPKLNIAIEYDGAGHYIPIRHGSESQQDAENNLKKIQYRDNIKTQYCVNNNIMLIRIPYTEFDNIETYLDKYFKNLHDDIV